MATENRLNQVVKGAPPPELNLPPIQPLPHLTASSQTDKYTPDPLLSTLPSAPPQIYLSLLILESSLRAQYLHLLSRRRLNTFFLLLLGLWNSFFFYALFLRPREDGTGLGGSVYWVVETSEKLALLGGTVTVLLVYATGQLERGVRWPRRWLGTTNRGLRGFNLRVVVVKRKWWREMAGYMANLIPFGLWLEAGGSDWHMIEQENGSVAEEDLAKGGDHVMLLLLPKSFSPEFRENWEEYRSDYWEKENERRRQLRRKIKHNRRLHAKEEGGWIWWTGAWRLLPFHPYRRHHDLEKHPHQSMGVHGANTKTGRRRSSRIRTGSTASHDHSRQSSRSSTPHIEFDGSSEQQATERVRRGSSVSSTASVRRKVRERREAGGGTGLAGGGLSLSPLTSAVAVDDDANMEIKPKERPRRSTKSKGGDKEKERDREKREDKEFGEKERGTQHDTPGSEFDGMVIPAPRAGVA